MAVMSDRALGRATLHRQHLLEPAGLTALEMIEHLVGMQAQAPWPPYVGLWTRLRTFDHKDLARLLEDRSVVRLLMFRGTVHLVSSADCLALRPLVQRVIDRMYVTAKLTAAVGDPDAVADRGRRLLAEKALTPKEIGDALAEHLPGVLPRQLGDVVRARLPLVQVPPRAVWGVGGATRYATAESWLGAPLQAAELPAVIRRYLAAFGPATVADVQAWSGLTRLREITDAMPGLLRLRDEHGGELLDLPDAPRPDPDVPAPVRFLPDFDNVVLSHARRSRIIRDEHRPHLFLRNGIVPGSFLVDGLVEGTWRADDGTVTVRPFNPPSDRVREQLAEAGEQLARFLAPPGTAVAVRFADHGQGVS
ncbi:winged helix DNA-binding domain-containing protein [Kitasatospora griseola]|uniref:winged helix DNA-binding domain-containing protein n=1 Tax=Kitasatospora griseola TaxID=2064 RepID=UPI0005C45CC2|nr:winged helix DNA-binding domain-containing protein [Kitasatospora griseola]